jgi:hypothetical protein
MILTGEYGCDRDRLLMAYSDLTLEDIQSQFQIDFLEQNDLFEQVEPVQPSQLLQDILADNIPLALSSDTEKARSEMIVAPILIELRRLFDRQISLFSGIEFNVDRARGLNGRCDFIISQSASLLSMNVPVLTLVEAKNDNIKSGIPQCIGETIAAQIFNAQRNHEVPCIYGIVTTGSIWKFLKLERSTVKIELREHFLENLAVLLGILSQIVRETKY